MSVRLIALTALGLMAACAPAGGLRAPDGGVYAPAGVDARGQSVDGLIVGHRLMAAAQYELALDAYLRAAAEQGLSVDTLSALGSANLKLGRLGQSERLLRQAVDMDETFAPAWNNLGVVLMETGQIPEAQQVFRKAYALDNGESDSVRDNLRLALAKSENPANTAGQEQDYKLVRRGSGEYLIRTTP